MEEGGVGRGEVASKAKNELCDKWKKVVEREERLNFFQKMVRWGIQVREVEYLGEEIHNKLRSEIMRGGKGEKEIVRSIMKL